MLGVQHRGFVSAAGRLVLMLVAWLLLTAPARAEDAGSLHEAVLEVIVNSQTPGETLVVLRDDAGGLWLDERDLARLHLRMPSAAPSLYQQRRYYPLSAIPGGSIEFDEANGRALISLPGAAFLSTQLSAAPRSGPVITPASPGAFLNYQLSDQRFANQNLSGGTAELGVFGADGVLTSSAVARFGDGENALVRLDTTYTKDFPARLESLQLGDVISDPGSWGTAVRFGGIHWGTNFGLRPDLLTTPLLAAGGTAVLPSTVDVFVNNQKVSSQSLPPGPFVVDQLPALTGSGDVTLVVRDALGRQQLITQPFYSSLTLLAPGLSQYGLDLGVARDDYALLSDRYAGLTGAATYRRGLSSTLTVEAHGEFLGSQAYAAGADLATALGHVGVLSATLAGGGGEGHDGTLGGLAFERQSGRFSLSLNSSWASPGYQQVSDVGNGTSQFKQRNFAQVGVTMTHSASLQVAYADESFAAAPGLRTLSLSYSQQFFERVALSLTVTRTVSAQASSSVFLLFSLPLSGRQSVTAGGSSGQGSGAPANEINAQLVESPPVGPGFGYRLGASTAGNYTADGRWQSTAGDLEAEAVRNQGISGQMAQWSGAATLLDGQLRTARTVNDSFAVVDLAGLPHVPVYINNQLVSQTDDSGRAMLHDLLPYQVNRISIDPVELPLDAEIDHRMIEVAPPYRSGVVVRFPVEKIRAGVFKLVTEDGSAVPAGAVVSFNGGVFPVALDGAVYVTGFDHGLTAAARWADHKCSFRIDPPPANDPQPDMGTIVCREHGAGAGLRQ